MIINDQPQAELLNAVKLATLYNMAAGISHEMNSPLGVLHSNNDQVLRVLARLQNILADDQVDAQEVAEVRKLTRVVASLMGTYEQALERMVLLVDRLGSFARLDRANMLPADLHQGLDDSLAMMQNLLGPHIRVERRYGPLPAVRCHAQQVNQAFLHLLTNAAMALDECGGTITMTTHADAERAVVAIADDGNGIPEEQLERVFEPGFTTWGNRMGLGLGLAITRYVAHQHGGQVEVSSEPGLGTVVRLELPLTACA